MNKSLKKFIIYIDGKVDIKKFLKFGTTGLLNTAIHLLVFTLFSEVLKTGAKSAQAFAYITATANSYIVNKNWTFGSNKKRYTRTEIFKFLLVNLISMSLSVTGMYVFHDRLGINKYICQIPIACITTSINYFGNKIFVFPS